MTPLEARKQLDEIISAAAVTTLGPTMKKTRDKVSESEKQEVYDIFDEMVKDVMIGVKHDLNKANAIIDQMTSGTITPTAAKQQLLAM